MEQEFDVEIKEVASKDQLLSGSERQYCDGTPGRKACKGDFPFLFEYKVEQDVDFVFIKGAN